MTTEPIDLIPANQQVEPKVFVYKVKTDIDEFVIAVIATTNMLARENIKKQFPTATFISFQIVATKIMQVQGEVHV